MVLRTLVLGVLNATDDSFSGDGLGDDLAALEALAVRSWPPLIAASSTTSLGFERGRRS